MIDLIHGDCVEYMKTLPDDAFDVAIVDPPYNIVSQQKRGVGSRIDKTGKMNGWNNEKPSAEYFKELFRVSKGQIIWGANNFEGLPASEYFIIWNKLQTVDNFATAEYAWVSPSIGKPAKIFTYGIHQHNADHAGGLKIHPTQKPVKLYEWLLLNYAMPGDTILDTHLGSGSSAIAAHNYWFDLVGIEIDAQYYRDAKHRLNEHQRVLRINYDEPGDPAQIKLY